MVKKTKAPIVRIVSDEDFYSPARVNWAIERDFNLLRETLQNRVLCDWVEDRDALLEIKHDVALQLARGGSASCLDEVERLLGGVADAKLRFELGSAISMLLTTVLHGDVYSTPNDLASKAIGAKLARPGSKASADKRSANASAWQGPALEEARRLRSRKPRLTQTQVAEGIQKFWGNHHPVGWDRLKKIISAWEKSGELPKRSKP